jgi:hypothetical protein
LLSAVTILSWTLVVVACGLAIWITTRYIWSTSKAERRAFHLMKEILSPQEIRQLFWRGYIDIPSTLAPQRVYRVPRSNGYVQVRENGRTIMGLCLQPVERLPYADVVILHKLMIEAQEEFYLQTANKFRYFDI